MGDFTELRLDFSMPRAEGFAMGIGFSGAGNVSTVLRPAPELPSVELKNLGSSS